MNSVILSGGQLAILGADEDVNAAFDRQIAGEAKGEVEAILARAMARIWVLHDDQLVQSHEFRLDDPFPLFDQFPDGRLIVANARSAGGANARILATDGSEIRRIELGDGIEHLKVANDGQIWVGWFDEGVCGNDHWKYEGMKHPPSSHGIAAFDEMGRVVRHNYSHHILDCYALNLVGNTVWACTYPHFSIINLTDEADRLWATHLSGVGAIAVRYPYVLAAGGYEVDRNRAVLLKLGDHHAETLGEWRLPISAETSRHPRLVDARGDRFFAVEGDTLLCWSVSDFVGLCG